MQIAFQGGDVRAEFVSSVLYFKARDLLAIVTNTSEHARASAFANMRKRGVTIPFKTDIESVNRAKPARYISMTNVISFLDATHVITRPQTMQLMFEFVKQVKGKI